MTQRIISAFPSAIGSLINGIIRAGPAPVVTPLVAPAARTGPAPRTDVAYAALSLVRDQNAAAARSPESLYSKTTTTVNPHDDAERHKSLALRTRTVMEDHQAPLRDWVGDVLPDSGQREDNRLLHALTNMYPLSRRAYAGFADAFLKPIAAFVQNIAKLREITMEAARDLLNHVPTIYHIITEGSAAYRKLLTDDIDIIDRLVTFFETARATLEAKDRNDRGVERAAQPLQFPRAPSSGSR
jgi:hypothetical protein